jgi:5-methylcytosine-specific restriction protein A
MASRTISYRAVHTNTQWRKVRGHTSLDNALYGRNDGAPGLFAHRVRIDYGKHGEPLYALIWEDGASIGFIVKKDSSSSDGTVRVQVPIGALLEYEARSGASPSELEAHFVAPADRESQQELPASAGQLLSMQGEEGAAELKEHLVRERDVALAEAKRRDVLKSRGRLACEACGFNFAVVYGEVGAGFCEVHHLTPLAMRSGNETTSLDDLAILCSNCHSIIHRTFPMWPVTDLAACLASRATADDAQPPAAADTPQAARR